MIRERRRRRNMMFVLCLGTLILVGTGFFFLQGWLEAHPTAFLGYWGLTGTSAVLMMLLAFYDMLCMWREGG
jgi:hypothetical protein